MYNDKGNTKYLKLLKQNYSSSQDVIREIVNLSAIINLPKGTEFFLSDIHGEYEAFLHIMNNCSGVIKEKVDLIFKDTISDYDRQELCTLIYYPREKMAMLDEQGINAVVHLYVVDRFPCLVHIHHRYERVKRGQAVKVVVSLNAVKLYYFHNALVFSAKLTHFSLRRTLLPHNRQ